MKEQLADLADDDVVDARILPCEPVSPVVACPMCHVNLDMKQADIERRYGVKHEMMVYYLSDLVGMALGMSASELGVDKHFVVK